MHGGKNTVQKCYNCGKEVDDNVLICPECGALVKRYGKPEPQQAEPFESQGTAFTRRSRTPRSGSGRTGSSNSAAA